MSEYKRDPRTSVVITTFGTFEVRNDQYVRTDNMLYWRYRGSTVFNCKPEMYLGGYVEGSNYVHKVG